MADENKAKNERRLKSKENSQKNVKKNKKMLYGLKRPQTSFFYFVLK